MPRPVLRHPAVQKTLLIGGVYFIAASAALMVSRFEGGLAFIWAANALLMAELLTSRTEHWLRAVIACAIASAAATTLFGMGPLAAVPMAAINMIEALIVATLCRLFVPDNRVTGSIRPLLVFILALCGVADVVTGLLAATVASQLTPVPFGPSFLQWYTGHALGGLTFTPILMMLLQGDLRRWLRQQSPRATVEAALLLALFALACVHVFYVARYPMLFAPLLPLVLIAFRVGPLGAAASVIILAIIGGVATLSGVGPLTLIAGTTGQRVQFLQFYIAISFLLCMPVAAELNARRRLFAMLQESEARFRAIAEHSGDVVLNIDAAGHIQYASPSAHEQIGCAPDLLVGQPAADLVHPEDRAGVIAAHHRAIGQPGSAHKVEFRPRLPEGDFQWCEMVTRAVVNERGDPDGVVSIIRDISRHKARQHALQQVAARDSLTGADSRRAFLEKLDREMERIGQGIRSSLLLIDIDHFKTVNDRHGHGAGDQVLSVFVERLRSGLRGGDSVGRLGGEEFAVLLTDSDVERAALLCERLRAIVAEPMPVGENESIRITFSAGLVALAPGSDRSAMLEAADKALYRAKHSGRNCLRLAA
ncbi:sensor domain-containing diguanylate cyclase [Sphingobium sp. CCH11-B1]|jgi:diguanylate cyclase (GGDEF)-like protein/PAS domain S-box-containing protein|uniref:sensor domain-containing diguanylate cyclase n=1 Tax=Sphingobium sp. CCH11-B1 TaxID=1768781 RepID=UPI00082A0B90|nr:sensor domain-containing diguanylate cyclase [Sphingobium sp. CCH11-B1]MEA3391211.1 diguanylate cyclase [Pseudomonadota bacterium]